MVLSTACLASSKGFDPKRATFPQHPSALRASEWLDSLACQALRHFHHAPATTLLFDGCPLKVESFNCSGRVLPLLDTLLKYQIQHAPVSVRLRLLRWYMRFCLLNSPTSLNSVLGCSLVLMFYTLTSAWYPCCTPNPLCGWKLPAFQQGSLSGTFSKFPRGSSQGP